MKAIFEAGHAREAFAQQRGALEALVETAFESIKQAAALITERAKSVAAAIRRTEDSSQFSAEPKLPSPPVVSHRGPSL
jgi:hypothetical protein